MNPFFFGSSQRPLFGIYHAPQARPVRSTGVVLCPPIGHEYTRTHRVLRHLAISLASAGCHVLRFDWYGVGDSGGDGTATDFRGWIGDVGRAVDELRDTAGVTRVSLVGVRLGATIAMTASVERRDVESLVLWDPVVDGARYLTELSALHSEFLRNEYPPPRGGADRTDEGLLGFPLGAALRDQLADTRLTSVTATGAREVHVLASVEGDDSAQLRAHLATLPVRFTYQVVPAPADWNAADRIVAALLPHHMQPALQGITALVATGAA
ncbi:MAG: alpha/beta fold hydrolase [Gemmatimonadaceae bacterium]